MSVSEEKLRSLVESYGDAWNTHDLDAIVAHHTEDSRFQLHVGGEQAEGLLAVREAFATSLLQWPDINFAAEDLRLGPDHVTARWTVTATLATALVTPEGTSTPTGRPIRFDAIDLLVWRDGQIARKDTYIDAITLQAQLAEQPAS